jgi:predicted nucleic acid-binding protein
VGIGKLTLAVADAGPLVHLSEIGCFSHLRIFDVLHIPDTVWSETVEQDRVPQGDVLGLGVVQRHTLSPSEVSCFVAENGLEDLHSGECECLYLCQQLGVSVILTDDLAVREAAKNLGLTPVGSLGIVVRAYRLGCVPLAEAERQIIDLYDVSSLFVTRTIVELAIDQLRQQSAQDSYGAL